jgi:hypothetical protein
LDTVSAPRPAVEHASDASALAAHKIAPAYSSYSAGYVPCPHYTVCSTDSLLSGRVVVGSILDVAVAGVVKAASEGGLEM